MGEVMRKQTMSSRSRCDMVVLMIATYQPVMCYQKAFEFLDAIRMGAKMAMRYDKEPTAGWRNLALIDADFDNPIAYRGFRRSREHDNVDRWAVNIEGPLVVVILNDVEFKIHYSEALIWYTGVRVSARSAKAWAGDTSKNMRCTPYLSDPEIEKKRGYG